MKIKEVVLVDVDLIDTPFKDINPNILSDSKFNRLVAQIKENGFEDPVKLVPGKNGRYSLYAGHHRLDAAKLLELKQVPAFIQDYDEDKVEFELFKDNFFRGEIDAQKFTELYNEMSNKYGEATQDLFQITDREFEKLYKQIKKSLPKDLQKKLEEAKKEIKSVEDLSTVLNKLFSQYGDTLEFNYMIIDFGGKESLWVRVPAIRWKEVKKVTDFCMDNKIDINDLVKPDELLDKINECMVKYNSKV